MERSLLRELTDTRLIAYLKANRFAERYWPTLFPLDFRDELTWESLQGEEGATIKADVVAYDASAPEKGREVIGKASGKIAKMLISRAMREEDFLMYKRLSKGAQGESEKMKILQMVFGDTDFCVNGILANCEYLSLQAASTGQLSFDKNNNNGLVTEKEIDLGVPKANKLCVSTLLSDKANADFIAEVKKIDKAARGKGIKLNYMWMTPETLDEVVELKAIRDAYGYFLTQTHNPFSGTLFQDDVNKLLAKNRLPQIILVDSMLQHEDKDHKRSTLYPWKPGYISFTVDKVFGRMQHGPIAEEDAESVKKIAIQAKKGHVLVTKWSEVNPVREWTKGEAHCFPVLKNPEDIWMLNTGSTTKFI